MKSMSTKRNSSIELMKVVSLLLIVISHVNQTLYTFNPYVQNNTYVLNVYVATTNIQQLVLAYFGGLGAFGNTVFFICSAWFLLDSKQVNKTKVLYMVTDACLISIVILLLFAGGGISLVPRS